MVEDELVSVVLPTLDRDGYLAEAVDSVLAQTYEPLELLVVDGRPDESTRRDVAARVGDEVDFTYVPQPEPSGAGTARNLGIEAASGEFLAFLDDDDRWTSEAVARRVAAFREAGSEVAVVYGGMTFEEGGEGRADFGPTIEGDVTRSLLLGNFLGSFSRIVVRASAASEAGPIDEALPTLEDWEWYVRLSQVGEFRAVPESLTVRRGGHGRGQLSHDVTTTVEVSLPRFLDRVQPVAAERGRLFERRFVASVCYRLGWAALMRERYPLARSTLWRGLRAHPLSPRLLAVALLALGGRPLRTVYACVPNGVTKRVGERLRRWR